MASRFEKNFTEQGYTMKYLQLPGSDLHPMMDVWLILSRSCTQSKYPVR
jgi:hypothetical protein